MQDRRAPGTGPETGPRREWQRQTNNTNSADSMSLRRSRRTLTRYAEPVGNGWTGGQGDPTAYRNPGADLVRRSPDQCGPDREVSQSRRRNPHARGDHYSPGLVPGFDCYRVTGTLTLETSYTPTRRTNPPTVADYANGRCTDALTPGSPGLHASQQCGRFRFGFGTNLSHRHSRNASFGKS